MIILDKARVSTPERTQEKSQSPWLLILAGSEMDMLNILLGVLLAWTLIQAWLLISRATQSSPNKLPPGPKPFPIIGNLLHLGDNPHKSLAELAKTYGPIMTIKLGQVITVIISSPTMAKQVLQKQDVAFSNRPLPDFTHAHNHYQVSVAWLPVSTRWRNLRKICNSHIFSTHKLDANHHLRRLKVEQLIANVRECCLAGVAVDIGRATFETSLSLLSNTIFSVDLADSKSNKTAEIKEMVCSMMEEAGKLNLADYFPVFKKMDPQGIRRRMAIHYGKMIELFDCMIKQRLELKKVNGYLESNVDMLDTLLSVSEDHGDEINHTGIKHLLLDLFAAGTDTTSTTLEWAMTEILHNPKILSKARAELEQTIGKGKQVEESDITRLPYLQAIIKETFRLHPPAPLLLPHKVETDVEVCGFTVPKGAQVLVNAWAIGRDPSIWENPNLFMPERFLGSQVDVRGKDFELIPFGAGRRICPGLPLATRMVHLMLGSLINSFDWKLEDGIAPEDMKMEEKFGFTLKSAQPLHAIPFYT
ncbi:unnamed protein product [Camellia sinensis]